MRRGETRSGKDNLGTDAARPGEPTASQSQAVDSVFQSTQSRVVADRLLIVEILRPQRDRIDPLSDHLPLLINRKPLVARIGQAIVDRINQADLSIDLAQQQHTCVGSEYSIEIGNKPPPDP